MTGYSIKLFFFNFIAQIAGSCWYVCQDVIVAMLGYSVRNIHLGDILVGMEIVLVPEGE